MEEHKEKKWFVYFTSETYKNFPSFYDASDFEWGKQIESIGTDLVAETNRLINQNLLTFQSYFIEDLSKKNGWQTFSFKTWDIKINSALKISPLFKTFLEKHPEIVSLSINLLNPQSRIAPHHGDSNTFYRVHMGVNIPDKLPSCGFKVNEDQVSWEEGRLTIFNDANKHEAWNLTDEPRIILVFDVIKKEYLPIKNLITTKIRSILLIQFLFVKIPFTKKLPKWMIRIGRFKIQVLLLLLLPVQRFTGVIKKHN